MQRFIDAGADWVDVGGESTRPGAELVSEQEEMIGIAGHWSDLR